MNSSKYSSNHAEENFNILEKIDVGYLLNPTNFVKGDCFCFQTSNIPKLIVFRKLTCFA